MDGADLSPLVKGQNQGFPVVVDSDSVNKQGIVGEAESSVWSSSHYTEYVKSHCQQMAAALYYS